MVRYRRNADSDLRDLERQFLSSGASDDYQNYLAVCQRIGIPPEWCGCGKRAIAGWYCNPCSQRLNLPVMHCEKCQQHVCSGTVTDDSGEERPCSQDLLLGPKCYVCEKPYCPVENCSENQILDQCRKCEKEFCDSDECGDHCEECGVAICRNCWFECETHNSNHYCDDCTTRCEYCPNDCCPQCVCIVDECGISICSECPEASRAGICHVCQHPTCEEHNLECALCEESVCEGDSKKCRMKDEEGLRCEAVICNSCDVVECNLCNKAGCGTHFDDCILCQNKICFTCSKECTECGEIICDSCSEDHEGTCVPKKESPSPTPPALQLPELKTLRIGSRVRYIEGQLLGTVIKLSEKEGITKYIVEWDDESVGKYLSKELQGPISSRRKFRRY